MCDDNNNKPYDGCDPYCAIEPGYTCTAASPSVCTEICGDGIDYGTNKCDDGNKFIRDGCDNNCLIVRIYYFINSYIGTRMEM